MGNYKDLRGQRFGKLTVVEDVGRYSTSEVKWLCKCDCGGERIAKSYFLNKGVNCCTRCNFKDFTGQQIGLLKVIRRAEDKIVPSGRKIQWECECSCGKIVHREVHLLNRGRCSCEECKAKLDRANFSQGYNLINGSYWNAVQRGAKKRGLEFSVSLEHAWDLFTKQGQCCALSGMPIEFAATKKKQFAGETTASLDRIYSNQGYVEGNVQWLHKTVNKMKLALDPDEFIDICRRITERNKQ